MSLNFDLFPEIFENFPGTDLEHVADGLDRTTMCRATTSSVGSRGKGHRKASGDWADLQDMGG